MRLGTVWMGAAMALCMIPTLLWGAKTEVPKELAGGSPELLEGSVLTTKSKVVAPIEPESEILARAKWWQEAKFGMFIHWGLYSALAGEWKGQPIPRNGEWIQYHGKIPEKEYAATASQFNPVKFNADEWVGIAKSAGMKYMVITAKHHDGFCMYDTKLSDFNIVKATPFKRDPVRELAEACKKAGIRFGVYYSNDLDWHENMWGLEGHFGKDPVKFDAYYRGKAMGQVKELLTNYGPICSLFFDGKPGAATVEQGLAFRNMIRSLQPDCLMNNRLRSVPGDISICEQYIPSQTREGLWEGCVTMNTTWGYKKQDQDWKPASKLIFNLVDCVSKGGNYLINVGPTGEGVIPEQSVKVFQEMGPWLAVNGEAIYGAGPTPFGAEHGAYSTTKKDKKGKFIFEAKTDWRCTVKPGKLYITLFTWPDGKFELNGVKGKVVKGYLLSDKSKTLKVAQDDAKVTVSSLPSSAPDKYGSVFCLETKE